MRRQVRPAITSFAILLLLTGVIYPLAVTGMAGLLFPSQARGSPVESQGEIVGSRLIGQEFSDPRYFWGRPSAAPGAPGPALNGSPLARSGGSNLGPLSRSLVDSVRQRVAALRAADPANNSPVPADLVTASASGLDPDISLAAAHYQVQRVARARGIEAAAVRKLVDRYAEGRLWGIFGEPRLNVLLLNLALDGIQ